MGWIRPAARIVFVWAVVAASLSIPLTAGAAPGAAPPALVTFPTIAAPEGGSAPVVEDSGVHARRARYVRVDAGSLVTQLQAPRIELELFPDVAGTLVAAGPPSTGAGGSTTWSGRGRDGEYATLTLVGGRLLGTALLDGEVYDIQPVAGTTHLITREGRTFPDELPPVEPDPATPTPGPAPPSTQEAAPAEAAPVVRVLLWYDARARSYFGSDAAAQAILAATVNEANSAYARSGAEVVLESAGIEPVTYNSSSNASTDLDRLEDPGDGPLDAIHARRDAVEADLVSLITGEIDGCGIANIGNGNSADAAFSVVQADCARGGLALVHELSHNLGAGHQAGVGDGAFPYSHGYIDEVNRFRTIMAYRTATCSCPTIAYVSGPTARYDGLPLGHAMADNARTISEVAPLVATYIPRRPPENDDFADAAVLNGSHGSAAGTTRYGTSEPGEPPNSFGPAYTIWYRWTGPIAGEAFLEAAAAIEDSELLEVFTGPSLGALTRVRSDSGGWPNGDPARVRFPTEAGRTYHVRIDTSGWNDTTLDFDLVRPDARIRRGTGALVGDGTYNTTGANQTRNGATGAGQTVTYTASVQNDTAHGEALRLRGGAGTTSFKVTYRSPSGVDITPAVTAGTFETPVLAPQGTYLVTITVKIKSGATRGATLDRTLTASSAAHTNVKDTVRFTTRLT